MNQVTMIHCNRNSEKFINFSNSNLLLLSKISYLNLDYCNNITDDIIGKYTNLKQLSLVAVNSVTDNCLVPLTKLERLNILNGLQIVKSSSSNILLLLPNIKYIKLNSTQIDIEPYRLFMSKNVQFDFYDLKD